MNRDSFDLAGKEYFTVDEAAHYCCVSHSQFKAKAAEYGLRAFYFMGKKVYKRADLQRAMERACDLQEGSDPAPDSPSIERTGFEILEAVRARQARRRHQATARSN